MLHCRDTIKFVIEIYCRNKKWNKPRKHTFISLNCYDIKIIKLSVSFIFTYFSTHHYKKNNIVFCLYWFWFRKSWSWIWPQYLLAVETWSNFIFHPICLSILSLKWIKCLIGYSSAWNIVENYFIFIVITKFERKKLTTVINKWRVFGILSIFLICVVVTSIRKTNIYMIPKILGKIFPNNTAWVDGISIH